MGKSKQKRFNEILSVVTKAKTDGLEISVDGRRITLDNTEKLVKDTASGKINNSEFKEEYNNIVDDVDAIANKPTVTTNQEKMAEIMLLLRIPKPSNKTSDEQPDTTGMPELQSEESAVERRNQQRQGLKILTPDRMLSRLPMPSAQLKAGNDSQKLINKIRQLLYSLYRSKRITKTIYTHLINAI